MGDKEVILPTQEFLLEEEEDEEQATHANALLQLLLIDNDNKKEEENSLKDWVEEIERITGYKFHDSSLLQQAFTHQSFKEGCSSIERFAYIGDAILNFIVSMEQFSSYLDLDPGVLTRLRAINVDTEKLARVALERELHKFLRLNVDVLAINIEGFRKEMKKYPLHSCGLIDAPKVLADIVESLIGAIFIDSNFSINTTSEAVKKLLEPMITPENLPRHPVTQLHEICQKNKFTLDVRDSWKETGEVEYIIDNGRFIGRAEYRAKRVVARNRAALDAYSQIINALANNAIQNDVNHAA